jgi:hypothetical protein
VPFRTIRGDNPDPSKPCSVPSADPLVLGSTTKPPDPILQETGPRDFILRNTFCYDVPHGFPDARSLFMVPGDGYPFNDVGTTRRTTREDEPRSIVVPPPPKKGAGTTDLASVPSWMWWLIASYGSHTNAALLHDALYVDDGQVAPVTPSTADRLFLTALRERKEKRGAFRHWLMWAAVSVLGHGGRKRTYGFPGHVLAVWVLTLGGIGWALAAVDWTWRSGTVFAFVGAFAVAALCVVAGGGWRAGVDRSWGWLIPMGVLTVFMASTAAALWIWSEHRWLSPLTCLLGALVLLELGLLWRKEVDPSLRWWLWPTAAIGLPIALIPAGLIVVARALVWCIDLGAAAARAKRTGPDGEPESFSVPSFDLKGFRI